MVSGLKARHLSTYEAYLTIIRPPNTSVPPGFPKPPQSWPTH